MEQEQEQKNNALQVVKGRDIATYNSDSTEDKQAATNAAQSVGVALSKVERMLQYRGRTIRSIMQSEIADKLPSMINDGIYHALNVYTNVNFDKLEDVIVGRDDNGKQLTELDIYLKEVSNFLINEFYDLNPNELKTAFSMWASGRIETKRDIVAWNGKISAKDIGDILRAYKGIRATCVGFFEQQRALIESRCPKEYAEELNAKTREYMKRNFDRMVEYYKETGDLEKIEAFVKPFWGRTLSQMGLLPFGIEEKREIVKEAKALARKQLGSDFANPSLSKAERESCSKILKILKRKADMQQVAEHNDPDSVAHVLSQLDEELSRTSFKANWERKYSILIVIKAIIKHAELME